MKYLVNSNSEQSAGWYPEGVAAVLLGQIGGWAEATPPKDADALDLSLLNADELKQHAAVQNGQVLTQADLYPEDTPPPVAEVLPVEPSDPVSVDNPNPGESADQPKE